MDMILTVAGLIAGISLFLYMVNALDSGKRAVAKRVAARAGEMELAMNQPLAYKEESSREIPRAVRELPDDLKDQMPQRRCPLCSSSLSRDEPLYATHIEVGKEKKILIYGCPYCHKWKKEA